MTETSGLAAGRGRADILWAHNDSGDSARLFAIGLDGRRRDTVAISGATAVDWEDLASVTDAAGLHWVYAGDIGDNRGTRNAVSVWAIPEPAPGATQAEGTEIALTWPDGPHNAETLLADPIDGDLYVITKAKDGVSGVFRTAPIGPSKLEHLMDLRFDGPSSDWRLVTAGDISADGLWIALRTYASAYLWSRGDGSVSVSDALAGEPCRLPLPDQKQGESLAWALDASALYTVGEGTGETLWKIPRDP